MISFVIGCPLLSFTEPTLAIEEGRIPWSSKNKHKRMSVTAIDKSRTCLEELDDMIDIDDWLRMPHLIAKDIAAGNTVCVIIINGFTFRGR